MTSIDAMKRIVSNAEEEIKLELQRSGKVATGKTISSINRKYIITDLAIEGQIFSDKSINYIIYGRRPGAKMAPQGSLDEWLKSRSIPLSADFAIRKSIAENGIKPTPILERATKKAEVENKRIANDYLRSKVSELLTKQLQAA